MLNDPHDEHNVVRLHEEFTFREHHCFVFELLEEGDLFEHLKATGFSGFKVEVIKGYAREIVKALVFLEEHKVIHCDLKPENILMVKDKRGKKSLKLVDFGSGSFRGEQAYTYV
jgi:dual specificity tyrosine-phosphorylation-regulated kinase 2/3/4